MTLREMRSRMDVDEYHDWVEYHNARPFGFKRAEQRHGDLLMSLWSLLGNQKTPKELRSSRHWQYGATETIDDMDPEDEAAMMLAKMGG